MLNSRVQAIAECFPTKNNLQKLTKPDVAESSLIKLLLNQLILDFKRI
jgi:hypothetical protein